MVRSGGQPAFGDGGIYPPVLLHVAFIVEGGSIVDGLGRHGGGVARQSVADGCCHVLGVEVVEVESVLSSYLGQAGAPRGEDGFAPLHGLDNGQAEAFAQRGHQQGGAVGIEPPPFGLADGAGHQYVGVGGQLRAELPCIGVAVVARHNEVVFRQQVHRGEEGVDVFLGFHHADAKEEGLVGVDACWGLLGSVDE